MSIVTVQSSSTAVSSAVAGGNLAIATPSGLAVGDFMFVWGVTRSNNGQTPVITPPAGWTTERTFGYSSGSGHGILCWKFATSGDVAGGSFTFSGFPDPSVGGTDDHCFLGMARITGVDPNNPIDGGAGNSVSGAVSSTTAMSNTGITLSNSGSLLIMTAAHFQLANGALARALSYAVTNNNPSWTEQTTQSATSSDLNNMGQSMAYGQATATGATGNATATAGTSAGTHRLQLIAIQPLPILAASVSDSTTGAESITKLVTSFINKSDATTITESITRDYNVIVFSVHDSTSITESVTARNTTLGPVSVSDVITITSTVHVTGLNDTQRGRATMRSNEDNWPLGMDDQTIL